ncbi:MAG TPA: CoA-binding protein [Thermoanaerobaculia bacterium]|nr:CoA-binding protein [Thermoanaerobaculia bacterium]
MRTVAILGASSQRSKFGNKSLRAHRQAGWKVLPVNLAGEAVEGEPSWRRLADLPERPERISVYLPPPLTRELLPEIAAAGAREVWFNPGSADPALLAEARALGIPAIDGCSIVDLGLSPSQFPDH